MATLRKFSLAFGLMLIQVRLWCGYGPHIYLCMYCEILLITWKSQRRGETSRFYLTDLMYKAEYCLPSDISPYSLVTNLPTLHNILVLSSWPTSCTNSCFIISLLYSSTCFEHCCAHHQEVKLYYTAYGIVTLCRWPSGAQEATCAPDGHLQSVTIPDNIIIIIIIIIFIYCNWIVTRWQSLFYM